MKSVLEDLYYEKICPFANCIEFSEEKQKAFQKMEDCRNQMLDSMMSEQKHLLEEHEGCANELTCQTEYELFIDGFRIGMKFALELLA